MGATTSTTDCIVEMPGGCRHLPSNREELTWLKFTSPPSQMQLDLVVKICPQLRKISLPLPQTDKTQAELESRIAQLQQREAELQSSKGGTEDERIQRLLKAATVASEQCRLELELQAYTLLPYLRSTYPKLQVKVVERTTW